MKTIKIMMTGLALCSALFTSCKKDNTYNATPAAGTMQASGSRIVDNNATVKFTSGTLNTNLVTVTTKTDVLTDLRDLHTWNLFDPISNTGFTLPLGTYPSFQITMDIAPLNGQPGLLLQGVLLSNDGSGNATQGIPITFIINTPSQLRYATSLMTINETTSFQNLLNIAPDKLTAEITADMWNKAMDYQRGTITISESQNPDLYKVMLRNLAGMLQISSLNPNPSNSPVTQAPSAAENTAVRTRGN